MRLRMTASLLSVLCSWVLWEKWILQNAGEPTARIVQAVAEAETLAECRAVSPGFAKERATMFRMSYKDSEYGIMASEFAAILINKSNNQTSQQYVYYCLPLTVDPYKDPQ